MRSTPARLAYLKSFETPQKTVTASLIDNATGDTLYEATGSNADTLIRQCLSMKDQMPGVTTWQIDIKENDQP